MKTTSLIALIGTTSAAAATLEADCKAAWAAGSKCTAALCWATTTIADTTTYKACTKFDTDADKAAHGTTADKCQFGTSDADKALCTNKICDAQTWTNCKTCHNAPQTTTCWSESDASEKCQFKGEGCTAAICADHQSLAKVATRPHQNVKKSIEAYYWSQQCTFAQYQSLKLNEDATTTDKYNSIKSAAASAASASKATAATDKTTATTADSTYTTCTGKTYVAPKTAAKECAAYKNFKDTADAKETSSAAKQVQDAAYVTENTTWMSVAANQDTLKAGDLAACLLEHTDKTCQDLKTTNDDAYTKAKTAATTADTTYTTCTGKTYVAPKTAATECAADKTAKDTADAKEAQVKKWVDDVDAALTNSWTGDSKQPQFELWMQWSFKDADLESDAATIQAKWHKEYTAAHADSTTTEAKVKSTAKDVTSTAATVKTTDAANKAKDHDAKTADAWTKAKTAHAKAVTAASDATEAHTAAVTKEAELEKWHTWISGYMTNQWADDSSQPHFEKWMKNSFTMADLKSDAAAIQHTQKADQATAKTALDTADAKVKSTEATVKSTAATVKTTDAANKAKDHDAKTADAWTKAVAAAKTAVTDHTDAVADAAKAKAKYDELTKWVAFGEKTLNNDWDSTTQAWQKTWYENKCLATKKTTEAAMEKIQDATEALLTKADAAKVTLAADVVTDTKAVAAAKKTVADEKSTATAEEKKTDADAVTAAEAKLTSAQAAVTANADKIAVLTSRKEFGAAILANTFQAHQITWMKAKINGADTLADAQAIQDANEKALKDHKATLATKEAAITAYGKIKTPTAAQTTANTADVKDVKTLKSQIAQETTWTTDGTAELKDAANIKKWDAAKKAADKKKAEDDKKKKADSKTKAKATAKPTEAELKQALATAQKDAKASAAAVKATEAKIKTAKCATTGKDSDDCKTLEATLKTEKATAADDTKAVATAEAALKAHGGSSVGIIIGCVAVALVVVGGVAYYMHKKNAEKSQDSGAEMGTFTSDDCYTAFVDNEL